MSTAGFVPSPNEISDWMMWNPNHESLEINTAHTDSSDTLLPGRK